MKRIILVGLLSLVCALHAENKIQEEADAIILEHKAISALKASFVAAEAGTALYFVYAWSKDVPDAIKKFINFLIRTRVLRAK